ncbi:caspase recruitment domain-containing protein 8-like [Trachinotus anak]|uniref:caspase recruitment domain-containing protein 8-like n=1 Tax=Trachinotus anak TaxID=443729 RepID=UPI0039F1BE8B
MKRRIKAKHQCSSADDEGGTSEWSGDTLEKKKQLVQDRDKSADTNPQSQTFCPHKDTTFEERESSEDKLRWKSRPLVFESTGAYESDAPVSPVTQSQEPLFASEHLSWESFIHSSSSSVPVSVGFQLPGDHQDQPQYSLESVYNITGSPRVEWGFDPEFSNSLDFSTMYAHPQQQSHDLHRNIKDLLKEHLKYQKFKRSLLVEGLPPIMMAPYHSMPSHYHVQFSTTDASRNRMSRPLTRIMSFPSQNSVHCKKNSILTRSKSLPDMMLKTSYEEFTPDITDEENDESYSFQCSRPGLYQCSVTDLLFHMEEEGVVVYRIVPWNRRLLAQYHKKPAGPLFDIKCVQKSVCQLHLPHCEISSTGGCHFLSVAHVNDEGIEFITPHKITETHVIINISGFSGFGNVKDEDSPPVPVRALVLLFYRPPTDPDPESLINVLLLPKNVSLRDVQRTRKKLVGDERYIETSPHCKLQPDQVYTLSTGPEDDSVLVQPAEAEFDCDNYDNFFPSFQVILEKVMKHMKLFLRDSDSSHSVWERRVCLSSAGVKRSCGQSPLNLPPNQRLLDTRSSFIDGISGPVLKTLLDKLLDKRVITDSERESVDGMQDQRDKARFVIDTVRKKGEAASSEMIEFLSEIDPFLCEHLGLT